MKLSKLQFVIATNLNLEPKFLDKKMILVDNKCIRNNRHIRFIRKTKEAKMYIFNKVKVNPQLPKQIGELGTIANNLWWSWNIEFLKIFKLIDIDLWERCDKNPVKFLKLVDQEKLENATKNDEIVKLYETNLENFKDYMRKQKYLV